MDLYDIAYYLLKSNVGAKSVKEAISMEFPFQKSPNLFKEFLLREQIKIIPFWDERYPLLLKQIADCPALLFAKGDISLLQKSCVTMVGSRKMSVYSEEVLKEVFSRKNLLSKDLCFVSGLAYGVDSEVHRLCLKKNLNTIGVVGGGLEKFYYRGNSVMYKYLSKYRLVLSEFPPGREFFKGMFLLRNRILAGMSDRTFVIQAAQRSGALNTAAHANNYGRDVFVVPNNILDDSSQGCLNLIEQGAGTVVNIDDFLGKINGI